MPIVLAKLAPRCQHAYLFEKCERERPDGPCRFPPFKVPVAHLNLPAGANGLTNLRQFLAAWPSAIRGGTSRVEFASSLRRSSGSTAAIFAKALRAASASLSSVRLATQREPTTIASISSSENISGGSMKPGRRTYPTPGSPSICAPCSCSVAIQRARTDTKLLREGRAADGVAAFAHGLHQVQEAFRPRHSNSPDLQKSSVSAYCQIMAVFSTRSFTTSPL
jgi:hypothetical protein